MKLTPNQIAKFAQFASVLEVSGKTKPGNVHRNRDYDDMVFEDFLLSAVAVGDVFREATTLVDVNKPEKANLGKYIREAVAETNKWVKTNTNLGIMMMCIPIACSASISDSFDDLQVNVKKLMDATTVDDACDLYDAINLADASERHWLEDDLCQQNQRRYRGFLVSLRNNNCCFSSGRSCCT